MTWVRASEFAAQRGVCKKTAIRMAKREGYMMEKRPVRGGWAWFVDVPGNIEASAPHWIDSQRFEQCISLALKLDSSVNNAARLAARLYEVL